MKFREWVEEYEKEFHEEFSRRFKENPRGIPMDISKRLRELFIGYKTFKETRRLVIATWILAIATIILSIITLVSK
mgnify:CR=1 FL=1